MYYGHHNVNKICIHKGDDIIKTCNDICFNVTHLKFSKICNECMTNFYNDHMYKLNYEIQKCNERVIMFVCNILTDFYKKEKNYLSIIYPICTENHDHNKRCSICAINKGNPTAMVRLAMLYQQRHQYELMKKYYLMAISSLRCENNDHNNCSMENCDTKKQQMKSMYLLAHHYQLTEDYTEMIRYYNMAINNKSIYAMTRLGDYYSILGNKELSKKYRLMAANHGHSNSIIVLISQIGLIKTYCMIENKEFFINTIQKPLKDKLDENMKNSINELCQSCYLENNCWLKNGVYLCGLCL